MKSGLPNQSAANPGVRAGASSHGEAVETLTSPPAWAGTKRDFCRHQSRITVPNLSRLSNVRVAANQVPRLSSKKAMLGSVDASRCKWNSGANEAAEVNVEEGGDES